MSNLTECYERFNKAFETYVSIRNRCSLEILEAVYSEEYAALKSKLAEVAEIVARHIMLSPIANMSNSCMCVGEINRMLDESRFSHNAGEILFRKMDLEGFYRYLELMKNKVLNIYAPYFNRSIRIVDGYPYSDDLGMFWNEECQVWQTRDGRQAIKYIAYKPALIAA